MANQYTVARIAIQLPLPIEGEIIEVQLSKGYVAIIDAVDAPVVLARRWYARQGRNDLMYACAYKWSSEKQQHVSTSIHRLVIEQVIGRPLESHEIVDHIDSDGLNNRRSNLRLTTYAGNIRNARKRSDNKSGYKGVHWDTERGKWFAAICVNGKTIALGRYDTAEEAHEAYKKAAIKHFGEYARFE